MTNANEHFGAHIGTEHIYTVRPFPITYTDGVRDLVENCQAYWLMDAIISHQEAKWVNQRTFQVWELARTNGNGFRLIASDGNGRQIARQKIPYSDFPFDKATIWLVNGTLFLPHEY